MRRFEDKVVLVTGAGSGIGAATAARFLGEGASVCCVDIDAGKLPGDGDRTLSHVADVTQEAATLGMITACTARFGGLDVLVNNAGLGAFGPLAGVTTEAWRRVLGVCLDAVFFACRAAMPVLVARGGCVVNTASISGLAGDFGFSAYNAAKGGVVNLTRSLAIEFAARGVRVNAVCPGLVATPLTTKWQGHPRIMPAFRERIPMRRAAAPEEIAGVIAFLASADAGYVTGVALPVDGGVTAATGQPDFLALL